MAYIEVKKKAEDGSGIVPLSQTSLIPLLSADSPNVISSGYAFDAPAWHAFDGLETVWVSNLNTSPNTRYIGYKFSEPVLCNKIKLLYKNEHAYFKDQYPARYKIQGSNDNGTTWTDIYEDFWVPVETGSPTTAIRELTFENSTAYSCYRLLFGLIGPDNMNYLVLGELNFYQVVYGALT